MMVRENCSKISLLKKSNLYLGLKDKIKKTFIVSSSGSFHYEETINVFFILSFNPKYKFDFFNKDI
jgi:hypothetical protein